MIARLLCLGISALFLAYLLLPAPAFPLPPPGSLTSTEPGDVRFTNIRAYFTDLPREQVIAYFTSQFNRSPFLNLLLPTIRLRDYPPEEAPLIIMDELKSSYLEELVHPQRESIFINGWVPTDPRYAINVDGRHFENKITIRLYPSHPINRFLTGLAIIASIWLIYWAAKRIFNK